MYIFKPLLIGAAYCTAASIGLAQMSSSSKAADAAPPVPRVEILSASQMHEQDAGILAMRRNEISAAAELNGFDINSGTWLQNQVVCPDAPRHLIMHYVKLSQDGSVSLFTAIVPRDRAPVRIIPVLYHGAPATHVLGSSEPQRALINEVISTKSITTTAAGESDWTSLAYCYAALGGAEPSPQSVTAPEETTPILVISPEGKVSEMNFSATAPDHLFQDWKILFDRQTQVKSIELSSRTVRVSQPVPAVTAKSTGHSSETGRSTKTVPESTMKWTPVPVAPVKSKPIPAPQ